MHLFYHPDLTPDELTFDEEESKHCIRVLRMKKGDVIDLADGKGMHATGFVADDHPKKTVIRIASREQLPRSHAYHLHIAVAPTKNFDRMEWFIEKAVESGINEISFIETVNSERSKVNMERCEKIAISAMKQSKQWHLPVLNEIRSLGDFLNQLPLAGLIDTRLMAWCETADTAGLIHQIPSPVSGNILVLIGPEGDFTAQEAELAKSKGLVPVSLGTTILRTETAALYACMAVKAMAERMK